MTILYEVKTGHTEKVLKAFARLYNENKKGTRNIMIQYGIMAGLLLAMPRVLHFPIYGWVICWALGGLLVGLGFSRNYLTYRSLLKHDELYKNKTEIRMSFGHSAFVVQDKEKNTYKYHLIHELDEDDEMFFFYMEEGDMFMIPKEDFVLGTAEEFREFIERSTDKKFNKIHLNLKERILMERQKNQQKTKME